MTIDPKKFDVVCDASRRATLIQTAADTLEWDERTGMPVKAGDYRAEQVAALRSEAHRIRTDDAYGDALGELVSEIGGDAIDPRDAPAATIRELNRDHQRDRKLPPELVRSLSLATVRGQQAWDTARQNDSFAEFRDALANVVDLKREQAACYQDGTDKSLYECLLDEYEPGASESELVKTFAALREPLVTLIESIRGADHHPSLKCLKGPYEIDAQRKFSHHVCEAIGFDFSRGRLDETSHPFCTTLGPNDIRILTRFDREWLAGGLYGSLHEAGHGMYEQGLPTDWFGLPPGSYASLGVHESQSRLWENQVGRSREFLQWLHPHAKQQLGSPFAETSIDEIEFACNSVQPSLIRVEADEATYNLHIILRFDLERQLINGSLQVDDLPSAWNDRYESDLGVRPKNDADGVLQDVHWSAGLLGYFPTYTIGNLISAQLYHAAGTSIGDLPSQLAAGDFSGLLSWLREHVHSVGRCHDSQSLVQQVAGTPISPEPLVNYLTEKLSRLYRL